MRAFELVVHRIRFAPLSNQAFNLLIAAILLLSLTVSAEAKEVIEFPDEDLASESVLPVFDSPDTLMNRRVVTAKRFEIAALGGLSLMEPFFNQSSIGLAGTYHFTEVHGLNIFGTYYMQGINDNARGLNPIPGTNSSANLQFAPAPKHLIQGSYQFTPFYGKISITKDFVMNLSLYGLLGAGMMGIGDVMKPAVNVGLGQKFYFTKDFALRVDLRFIAYQGPDILSIKLDTATSTKPASEFSDRLHFSSLLSFGAVYLLPAL